MNAARPILLIVDDEAEVLRSLHDLFRLDYRVLTFERPAEALEALRDLDPAEVSVILSDQRMPEMHGVQFLAEAQRSHPHATRLLMTGFADIRAVIDAINRGHVARYIHKPWDPDELMAVVRQAAEQRALILEKYRLIRELKETNARLLEANRLKGKFIEVASHELNTPVTVVLGLAELWSMTQGPSATEAERAWVDRIGGAGRRLASTVDRMLKLLKAGGVAAPTGLQRVELAPRVIEAVEGVATFLQARHQAVVVDLDPDLGDAEVDPLKLSDIVTNLVVNAIKFTPDGGTVRVEAGPDGPDRFRVEVSDRGIGISSTDRSHLFEPFFTGNDTMHHSSGDYQYCKKGMGLGLCLVKAFVEQHGGTIAVDTEAGRGSTFAITLPRRQVAGPRRPAGAPAVA